MDNKFVISDLETLGAKYVPEPVNDGLFNVEEFRKSLTAPLMAKVLQFPAPAVEVPPAAVVTFEDQLAELRKPFDIHDIMRDLFAPLSMNLSPDKSLSDLDHRPEWLRKFSAPDMAIYNKFPSLSQIQCDCEDCTCTEHPTLFVETRYASFKLCQGCKDDCAKHIEKVVDFDKLTDEQLCNDWELRR